MQAFFHGFLLALGLILPLGVQNLFVFNQGSVQRSLWGVVPVVITASVCDTLLIVISIMGISLLLVEFETVKLALTAAGIAFLLYMGYTTWRQPSQKRIGEGDQKTLTTKQQVLFATSVSLLNPHAILDTIGVIGTSSIGYGGVDKLLFTAACILVSWLWFFLLGTMGWLMGTRDWFFRRIELFNKISAVLIWGSAIYMIETLLGR